MMSSEGGGAQAAAVAADPNLLQYRADGSQGHTYQYYPSPSGSTPISWPVQEGDHTSAGNRSVQHVSYQYNPQQPSIVQDTTSVPSTSTSTASGTDNSSHMYTNYATYPTSTNSYGYASSEYTNYYSGYQQQPTQPYTQATGAYQNSGSPYQPISSFQNPGSYAGSTSYSSTYYNPGDYQTTGAYTGSDYNNQTNLWSQGNYTNYPHQYGNYSHDSSSTYSSSNAAAATDYQQHCQQWADYYSSQTEVTCAPGTENTAVPATAALPCPIPGVSSGYAAPVSQPQASYTPAWKPETTPPALPSQQASSTVGAYDDYWKHATQTFQNQPTPSLQSNFQKPQAPHSSVQDQQQTLAPQITHLQYTEVQQTLAPQLPHLQYAEGQQTYPQHTQQNYPQPTQQTYPQPTQQTYPQPTQHTYPQSAQQTYPQPAQQTYPTQQPYPTQQTYSQQPAQSLTPADTLRVSKLQIPTNPRIASHLAMPKTVKDTATSSVASKPAYVSVSLSNPNNKVLSSNAPDSNLKPGIFPASLRGYVERALARCKDEKQRAASQEVMKEIITKATADGTLHSRDWDIEPLFPLPDISAENNEQSTAPVVSMSIFKRSPSRRTKSRWEPLPEDKPIEKPTSTYQDSARHGLWSHFNGRDHKFVAGKSERKDAPFSRLSTVEQNSASRSSHRPSKKQRFNNDLIAAAENGDASSDSDKEQGLTAYYSGAITLANSPEERKRRESRSKRFERGNGQRTENRYRPKHVNSGNLYARRATALVLSKTFDDGGSRAVEDIDWDALTVKGTCQDIEKRYLRLTSAPDPSTVRPEEVLEKALHMVQNSQKNYLYKCDQLKSIRQDLTVQRIRNGLTVKVYETHARLALEFGDLPEFNQSQSQLKSLYGEGIEGCHMEFSAYNLLSISLLSNNRRDLLSLMSRLSDETKRHEAVKHALLVRSAVTSGNYVLFFKLYKSAPNLNTCLMDLCVEKMRFEAVKCMSRTYRPTIPVVYVAQVLGFSNTPEGDEVDVDGLEECTEWLKAHGACLIADNNGELMIDAKASSSSLYMPEPEDAVAHGDANLAVNDFFTRTST